MSAQNRRSKDSIEIALAWIRDNYGWEGQRNAADIRSLGPKVYTKTLSDGKDVVFKDPQTEWILRLKKVTEDAVSLKQIAQEISKKLDIPAEEVDISQITENEWEIELSYPGDPIKLMRRIENAFPSDDKKVLRILAKFKAMPFLELSSIANLDEKYLEEIVNDLESQDLVKVTNRENVFEEVVTLKEKGFAVA
jgi:hypothetical protein